MSTKPSSQCLCGYRDTSNNHLYTESVIVYFNETDVLPADSFFSRSYIHNREKGYKSVFRQGASPSNVRIGNSSAVSWLSHSQNANSLELWVDSPTTDHLVTGADVETRRQDIQYGSFRASMRSAHPWAGGSALSMMLRYNDSQSLEIDMLNQDNATDARITNLVNGEWPAQSLAINYTTLAQGSANLRSISPWDFQELRIDWTQDLVKFEIAQNTTRIVRTAQAPVLTVPSPMIFKHWSTGDSDFMQGPPVNKSIANVAWIRLFFNSSLMTADQHSAFDIRCQLATACSVDDITLRGSSSYAEEATITWKEQQRNGKFRMPAIVVAGVCFFFGALTLANIFFRRMPWDKIASRQSPPPQELSPPAYQSTMNLQSDTIPIGTGTKDTEPNNTNPKGFCHCVLPDYSEDGGRHSVNISTRPSADALTASLGDQPKGMHQSPAHDNSLSSNHSRFFDSRATTLRGEKSTQDLYPSNSPSYSSSIRSVEASASSHTHSRVASSAPSFTQTLSSEETTSAYFGLIDDLVQGDKQDEARLRTACGKCSEKIQFSEISEKDSPSDAFSSLSGVDSKAARSALRPKTVVQSGPAKQRVDYLAGLVAVSCLAVTFVHFSLTFLPYAAGGGMFTHYKSEIWARRTVGSYILTPIWIGPFFTTSSRFLAARYLKEGNLSDIANKMLLRAPRMVIPVIIIAMLEYFLIEEGLTAMLQWLPSITWSTWPYVTGFPNFAYFMNQLIELAYLIPNAAPQIVAHYCVGVLWTIPVQLQNSYLVLLAVVMIRDMTKPWKRFTFYAVCIANHWYAMSWGSCFWLGLMLADLEVTYKYTKWIQSRPLVHYPFLTLLWILTFLAPTAYLAGDQLGWSFMALERGVHPDPDTGLPIGRTLRSGYPLYFEPRFNTLMFAATFQLIVELSTWVQKFLSLKVFIWIFPHIMTVYLIHGFIFWSLGAWVCVTLGTAGVPYWANMLVVWTISYVTIALVSLVLTPLTEKTAQAVCRNVWRWASEDPVKPQPTLYPFPKNLFLGRHDSDIAPASDEERGGSASKAISGQKTTTLEVTELGSNTEKMSDEMYNTNPDNEWTMWARVSGIQLPQRCHPSKR